MIRFGLWVLVYNALCVVMLGILVVDEYRAHVFLLGWLLTAAFPHLGKERLSRRQVVQKVAAIAIVLGGTLLLHLG